MAGPLRHSFDHELSGLQDDILRMGSFVVDMLKFSVQALVRQDEALAVRVIAMDDTADQLDLLIEQRCMRLLALQQPMARDLRVIGTGLKVITDLERIGDYSVDIAKTARRLAGEPYFPPLGELTRMATATEWMVRECIRAYVEHDLELVEAVVARDEEVDECYDRLFTMLLARMERDPAVIRPATWLLHVARFLERMADHAVNVAERVCYVETGELKQLSQSHRTEPNAGGPIGEARPFLPPDLGPNGNGQNGH